MSFQAYTDITAAFVLLFVFVGCISMCLTHRQRRILKRRIFQNPTEALWDIEALEIIGYGDNYS